MGESEKHQGREIPHYEWPRFYTASEGRERDERDVTDTDGSLPLTQPGSIMSMRAKRHLDANRELLSEHFDNLSLAELTTHVIEKLHAPLAARLIHAKELIDLVVDDHDEADQHARQILSTFRALKRDLLAHLNREEERLLFPLRDGTATIAPELVVALRLEHQRISIKTRTLVVLIDMVRPTGPIRADHEALCTTIRKLETELADHLFLEEQMIFSRVLTE